MKADTYSIAGMVFQVKGDRLTAAVSAMPGFQPFLSDTEAGPDFIFCEEETPTGMDGLKPLYSFDSDLVHSVFSSYGKGHLLEMTDARGEQLQLYSLGDRDTVVLKGSFHPGMLRFALWVGYGLMTASRYRIAIHGSCIVNHGKAFLFLGESGTGKSTHTRLWREFIPGSALLNDDSPVIAAEEDRIWIYGSPWSGKTPCYKQERYPLCGCVRLSQAPYNKMDRLSVFQAYAALHPSCPPEFAYDEKIYNGIGKSLDRILSRVGVYHLACLPDQAAAELSSGILNR